MPEGGHAAERAERGEGIGMPEGDKAAAARARHAAERAERGEGIGMPEGDKAAPDGDSKKLAASGRHRGSSHSPPRGGARTAGYRRRKAIEAHDARQA